MRGESGLSWIFVITMAYLIGAFSPIWCLRICSIRYPTRLLLILFDVMRGVLAVGLGLLLAGWIGAWIAFLFIVLGNWYPFHPSCKPGNGIWIGVGSLIVLSPILAILGGLIFLASIFLTRFVFLSTWLTIAGICILSLFFVSQIATWFVLFGLGFCFIYRQKHHWKRYQRGVEPQIRPPYRLFK